MRLHPSAYPSVRYAVQRYFRGYATMRDVVRAAMALHLIPDAVHARAFEHEERGICSADTYRFEWLLTRPTHATL